jgi:O-antigen ligase
MEMSFSVVSSALWVPTEPLIFTFLAVWAVKGLLRGSHTIPRGSVVTSVALLLIVATVSSLQSLYPMLSVKALANAVWYAAFAFFFPVVQGEKENFLRRATWVLGGSVVFFSVYGLLFIARTGMARWTGNAMGRPFFPEHGTYSAFLSFGLAIVLGFALAERRTLVRWAWFAAAGTVALAVVLSLARAAYLGLAALVAVFLWYLLRSRRSRSALLLVASLGIVGFGVTKFRAGEFVGLYAQSITQPGELSNLERISRWLAAVNMVRDRPILGVGYGTYQTSYYSYRVLTLRTQERFRLMGVHSEYFEALSEMGWIGFGALVWFLLTVARRANQVIRNAIDPRDRTLALAALAGLSSYLVHGMFNNYSGVDKLDMPLWLLVAVVAVLSMRMTPRAPEPMRTAD